MTFPSDLDSFTPLVDNTDPAVANDLNSAYTAIEALEAKVGIDSSAVATSIDYLLKSAASEDPGHSHSLLTNIATAGNKVWIYQNVAWTGWTIEAVTDSVLAVKGGSQAYNVTGGQTAGSWTQPDHTLTEAELPAHVHPFGMVDGGSGGAGRPEDGSGNVTDTCTDSQYGTIGSGDAHSHGTTYRPLGAIGVIISKDA